MLPFHVTLHTKPEDALPGPPIKIGAQPISTLAILPHQLSKPFEITFEEAIARLEQLPRMFCEPDGSFVWVGENEEFGRWQIDGQLTDGLEQLQYVELKGNCPFTPIEILATTLSPKKQPLVAQLVRQAVFVDLLVAQELWTPATEND